MTQLTMTNEGTTVTLRKRDVGVQGTAYNALSDELQVIYFADLEDAVTYYRNDGFTFTNCLQVERDPA